MITASKFLSLGFLTVGIFILIQVILPLATFELWQIGQNYSGQILISPKSPQNKEILGVSIKNQNNFPSIMSSLKRETVSPYKEFSLSIPALKIDNLAVKVDSNDLSESLIHLPGSALPGEKGNVFISGHSALSQFFPGLTSAPFAKLTDIKKDMQITLLANNTKFIYKVAEIKIVDPSDLSVIAPPDNLGRYISLMTCVPPGLNLKRLIVLGKMI